MGHLPLVGRLPGAAFFFFGGGGGSKHPHSSFHLSSSYSRCVITFRTKTFWVAYRMRLISRHLLPPILKTTQSPTRLALANEAFTSPHDRHETILLLTCVNH